MVKRNRSNVLLVEILIAVLFFMLSATVLVQVFGTSRNMTVRAGIETQALAEAQNVADTLCAADDIDLKLEELSFISAHGVWTKNCGAYTLYIEGASEKTEAGELWQGTVRALLNHDTLEEALRDEEDVLCLPCARYRGGQR